VQPHAGAQTEHGRLLQLPGARGHRPRHAASTTADTSPTGSRSTSPESSTTSSATGSTARRRSSTSTRCGEPRRSVGRS
jgi:hypothetical protein